MKRRLVACALLLAALIPGCAKEDEEKIIPGYLSPGQFRPRGVLDTKSISFGNASFNKSCSGEECLAVYTTWLAGTFLVSGFAVSDKNSATPTYSMKVTQDLVGWKLVLVIEKGGTRGVKYEKIISRNDFTLSFCRSCEYSFPLCCQTNTDPDYIPGEPLCQKRYEAKGSQLVQATITFNNEIILENDNPIYGNVIIDAGDVIVAQAHNVSVDTYCASCP